MPIMVRPKGAAKRVAYKLLGVPQNMAKNKKVRRKKRTEDDFFDRGPYLGPGS